VFGLRSAADVLGAELKSEVK